MIIFKHLCAKTHEKTDPPLHVFLNKSTARPSFISSFFQQCVAAFLKLLDLLLLNKGVKHKLWHFLHLTISYILRDCVQCSMSKKCKPLMFEGGGLQTQSTTFEGFGRQKAVHSSLASFGVFVFAYMGVV